MIVSAACKRQVKDAVTYDDWDIGEAPYATVYGGSTETALKLSTVFACVDIISNDLGKIPYFSFDTEKKEKNTAPEIRRLLSTRPNEYMTPFVYHKLMETNRQIAGNAYAWKEINRRGEIVALIPLNPADVNVRRDGTRILYDYSGDLIPQRTYLRDELIHLKGFSRDGIVGISTLSYARDTIAAALAQEEYSKNFFERGGRPQAILKTAADLQPKLKKDGTQETTVNPKEAIRKEWEKLNAGPNNAGRVAILDNGMEYKEVAQMSAKDAAFVESKDLTVADIARFFHVPLHKLGTGKQSYNSNEQNEMEYANGTIVPILTGYEQEYTNQLLLPSQIGKNLCVKGNLNVLLRGDTDARRQWYKDMRDIGVYSVNDILSLEDLPPVEGGDARYASLNYIPLAKFEELSVNRNS